MPGANVLWNENSPAETDVADAAPIRSLTTSVRVGLAAEHAWPTSTGPGFGIHLLGSARPFYDVQSNVSSAGTDGRLLVTSDTSRLFHVGSAGTMFLGGQNALSLGSAPVGGQRFYWAVETGVAAALLGNDTITFPNSGFSGVPFVQVSAWSDGVQSGTIRHVVVNIAALTATQMNVVSHENVIPSGTIIVSGHTIVWLSIGTRTF